jgi:hypothetical protein
VGAAEITEPGKAPETVLVTRNGKVFRVYRAPEIGELVGWLRRELPPEG